MVGSYLRETHRYVATCDMLTDIFSQSGLYETSNIKVGEHRMKVFESGLTLDELRSFDLETLIEEYGETGMVKVCGGRIVSMKREIKRRRNE